MVWDRCIYGYRLIICKILPINGINALMATSVSHSISLKMSILAKSGHTLAQNIMFLKSNEYK